MWGIDAGITEGYLCFVGFFVVVMNRDQKITQIVCGPGAMPCGIIGENFFYLWSFSFCVVLWR